jgi:hypothetical protein
MYSADRAPRVKNSQHAHVNSRLITNTFERGRLNSWINDVVDALQGFSGVEIVAQEMTLDVEPSGYHGSRKSKGRRLANSRQCQSRSPSLRRELAASPFDLAIVADFFM